MTSNLGCVGLGVADVEALGDLLAELIPESTATRQEDGSALYVWRDVSGARLTITTDRAGAIADVTPSYDGTPGVDLAGLVALHHAVVAADVLEDGAVVTRMAVEVLAPGPVPGAGRATVTAFGLDVSVSEDGPETEVFEPLELSEDVDDEPMATMSGVVLSAGTHTVGVTGQAFHVARVRTVGMELDLCLAADDHPEAPEAGNVVGGLVYLVADVERPAPRPRGWRALARRRSGA